MRQRLFLMLMVITISVLGAALVSAENRLRVARPTLGGRRS